MKTFTRRGVLIALRASLPQMLLIAIAFTVFTFLQHISVTRVPIVETVVTPREPSRHDVTVERHTEGSILAIRPRKSLSDYIVDPAIVIFALLAWRLIDPRGELDTESIKQK